MRLKVARQDKLVAKGIRSQENSDSIWKNGQSLFLKKKPKKFKVSKYKLHV